MQSRKPIAVELENYGFTTPQIDIVLEYQKRLPVLQEDNGQWIDALTFDLDSVTVYSEPEN